MSSPHLFGIRHHGPGCARSLERALHALQPDCLLVEGPPEGEAVLPFILDPAIEPPVALLTHSVDDAQLASFHPFAEFSPEWRALRHALAADIPARFMDLPASIRLALRSAREPEKAEPEEAAPEACDDPLEWLGRAAGYGDGESWWNHMVEERGDGTDLFAAIREAMTVVRNEAPPHRGARDARIEALREAHMRSTLRAAQKEGFERIAVVCGAWHVSALEHLPPARDDSELLKGLPRIKVAATWVPWSNGNLSQASGYGAGVAAPGWYEHLWRHADRKNGLIAWLSRAARLFRDEDIDCSSAHIIEAARLAETLAALRGRPSPGLDELDEALRTTVCMGDAAPMQLIRRHLIVGERLGRVPASVPTLPLQRDIEQQQKSLRLKPEALEKMLDLDLRQDSDLARSHLLHRLRLLGIDWGEPASSGHGAKGTFHEIWRLRWEPALALAIVDASRWGNNIAAAATAKALSMAAEAESLPALAELVDRVLLADLAAAATPIAQALENRAALTGDAAQLLAAIPPLANVARYGSVRRGDATSIAHVLNSMVSRAAIGMAGACASLDDAAADTMNKLISKAHQAIRLAADEPQQEEWILALGRIAHPGSNHGLVCGLATRLRFDAQAEALEQTAVHMSLALSQGNDPGPAAAWLEGFLKGSAMVLLHDDKLWSLVDQWLASLSEDHFVRVLPLVRRTFAAFEAPERRQLGERARREKSGGNAAAVAAEWDAARAERPLPTLRAILGLNP